MYQEAVTRSLLASFCVGACECLHVHLLWPRPHREVRHVIMVEPWRTFYHPAEPPPQLQARGGDPPVIMPYACLYCQTPTSLNLSSPVRNSALHNYCYILRHGNGVLIVLLCLLLKCNAYTERKCMCTIFLRENIHITPGEGNGDPLQCSCLENSLNSGAGQAAVHGVAKSWTWLSDSSYHQPADQEPDLGKH